MYHRRFYEQYKEEAPVHNHSVIQNRLLHNNRYFILYFCSIFYFSYVTVENCIYPYFMLLSSLFCLFFINTKNPVDSQHTPFDHLLKNIKVAIHQTIPAFRYSTKLSLYFFFFLILSRQVRYDSHLLHKRIPLIQASNTYIKKILKIINISF